MRKQKINARMSSAIREELTHTILPRICSIYSHTREPHRYEFGTYRSQQIELRRYLNSPGLPRGTAVAAACAAFRPHLDHLGAHLWDSAQRELNIARLNVRVLQRLRPKRSAHRDVTSLWPSNCKMKSEFMLMNLTASGTSKAQESWGQRLRNKSFLLMTTGNFASCFGVSGQ